MNSGSPQYLEIEAVLREEVASLPPNTALPTEVQLAKRFSVSRITLRRALDMLEHSGLISRQRGRGTIVSPHKVLRRFSPLLSFEHDLRDQGIEFETLLVSHEFQAKPPEFIRRRLNIPVDSTAASLVFVRIVDDRIICTDRRYIHPLVARQLRVEQLEHGNTSGVVEEAVGMRIVSVDWESEIVPCAGDAAAALRIAPGTLVVANTFTYFLADGMAAEAGVMCYRVDRCKFKYGGRFNDPTLTQ